MKFGLDQKFEVNKSSILNPQTLVGVIMKVNKLQ